MLATAPSPPRLRPPASNGIAVNTPLLLATAPTSSTDPTSRPPLRPDPETTPDTQFVPDPPISRTVARRRLLLPRPKRRAYRPDHKPANIRAGSPYQVNSRT